ncbi:unnamed protein product [Tilletia caries]|nr:unnamed protein product [Tilletia caries]
MSLPGSRRRLPESVEDSLNRLILTFLLRLQPPPSSSDQSDKTQLQISCTQSFLAHLRALLDGHLRTLVTLVARASTTLGSSTSPDGRDWIRALGYVGSTRSVYGMKYGELGAYLRGRGDVDCSRLGVGARGRLTSGVDVGVGGGGTHLPPLGRFGSANGRSHALRSSHWTPSTDDWLDSEEDRDEDDEQQPNWDLYPSHSTSSRDQVRPVPHSGLLFKPPKQPVPIFHSPSGPPPAYAFENPDAPPLHPMHELALLLDTDAPPPPIGTIPNPNPPPIHTHRDAHGLLSKQTLSYLRACQDVIPPHLPAFPPRHTWRRTPVFTSTGTTGGWPTIGTEDNKGASSSNAAYSGTGTGTAGSSSSTLLVDRKLHAARLAQNSLRRLISATEEASARAAEVEMERREEERRVRMGVGEVIMLPSGLADESVKVVSSRLTPPASPPPVGESSSSGKGKGKAQEKEDDDDDVIMVEVRNKQKEQEQENGGVQRAKTEQGKADNSPRKRRKTPRPPGWGELALQPFTSTAPTGFFAAASFFSSSSTASASTGTHAEAGPGPGPGPAVRVGAGGGSTSHFTQRTTLPTMLRYGTAFVPSTPTLTVHEQPPLAVPVLAVRPSSSGSGSASLGSSSATAAAGVALGRSKSELVSSPTSMLPPSSVGKSESSTPLTGGPGGGAGPAATNRPRLSIKLKPRGSLAGGPKPGAGSP